MTAAMKKTVETKTIEIRKLFKTIPSYGHARPVKKSAEKAIVKKD